MIDKPADRAFKEDKAMFEKHRRLMQTADVNAIGDNNIEDLRSALRDMYVRMSDMWN